MLEELHLSNCKKITDDSLQLIGGLPRLKALYLMSNHKISNTGLQSLMISSLEVLHIHNLKLITDEGVCSIRCPNLIYIEFSNCSITDEITPFFQNHPKLESINLSESYDISYMCVLELSLRCPNLRSLNLSRCDITDQCLLALSENSLFLRKISLQNCNITDDGAFCLFEGCFFLEDVDFSWCKNLTDNTIINISDNPNLNKLYLAGTNTTDEGLMYFRQYGESNINYINLTDCDISDSEMYHLSIRYLSLQGICLTGCKNITEESIKHLLNNCPNIAYIFANKSILPKYTMNLSVGKDILFLDDPIYGGRFKLPHF
jgi:uncharacterized protein YjbI with pentapeptide repeats